VLSILFLFLITAPRKKLKYSNTSPNDSGATPHYFETMRNAAPLPPPYDNRMVAKMLTDIGHVLNELAEYVYANDLE